MVIPTVRIVVGKHNRRVLPVVLLLEKVDYLRQECLFIERVRIAGVRILVCRRLEETDGRQMPRAHRRVEIVDVILMIPSQRTRDVRAWD